MLFENEFEVDAPLARVWPALNNLPKLALCVPYTDRVTVVSWRDYDVRIVIRLGLISIPYDGELHLDTSDDATHRMLVDVRGKQSQGHGDIRGTVTLIASKRGENRTHVSVVVDAELSGVITSFGPSMIKSVARRLVAAFAKRFAESL